MKLINLKKLSKKKTIGLGVLIAIIVLIASYFIFYRQTQESQAAEWYNENWHYRASFDVFNNSSTEDLLDFQVPISSSTLNLATLFSAGKLKADFTDIRFTDKYGNLLDYWFPDATSTMDTVYVKFPTLTKAATTTVMMYYGNPSAADTRNGKNVFPDFFDDFADGNYTSGPKSWTVASGAYSVAGTDKYLQNNTAGGINTELTKAYGTWEFDLYTGHAADNYIVLRSTASDAYYIKIHTSGDFEIFRYDGATFTFFLRSASGYIVTNTRYRIKITRTTTGVFTAYIKGGGFGDLNWTQVSVAGGSGNNPFTDNFYTSFYRFSFSMGANDRTDNILWRQFAVTDPTVAATAGTAEEIGGGPVGYWKFDEGYGTTAQDFSSYGNDGTLTNMSTSGTSTAWVDGKVNKALMFDGVNDYVDAGDVELVSGNAISFGAWVKFNDTTAGKEGTIIGKNGYSENSGGYSLQQSGGNDIIYDVDDTTMSGILVPDLITQGVWTHLFVTYDGANVKLYQDGVLKKTTARTGSLPNNSKKLQIGAQDVAGYVRYFKGFIDEPKIFNYTLTAAQIKDEYNRSKSVVFGADNGSKTQGLVGWWKMDESTTAWDGAGDTVFDSSGNGNNGTSAGNAKASTTAQYGNSGDFDGTDDYVTLPATATIGGKSQVTVSAWVRAKSFTQSAAVYAENTSAGNVRLGMYINSSGKPVLYYRDSTQDPSGSISSLTGNTTLVVNTWYYITIVYNSDNDKQQIYVNGIEDAKSNNTVSLFGNSSPSMYIGQKDSGSEFDGLIDDVKIYSLARTPDQIMQDYLEGPGPIAYYNFNEANGTSLTDVSGNGNNSSAFGGSLGNSNSDWVVGKHNGGLKFDGDDDKITIPHNAALEPVSISVGLWVKLSNIGARHVLFTKWNGYTMEVNADKTFKWGLNGPTGQYFGTQTIEWDKWYYLVGTFDNLTKRQCNYINGAQTECQTITGSISYNGADLIISGDWSNSKGVFDEAKVFNYALTPWQVAQEYNGGLPIVQWSFDEGQGTTAYNTYATSSNALAGTLTNMSVTGTSTAWVTGKMGKALQFDGVNDYLNLGGRIIDATQSFTYSAWVKTTDTDGQIYMEGNTGNNNPYAGLGLESSKATFAVRNDAGTNVQIYSTVNINDNKWHHLVGVRNITLPYVALYVDGVLVATSATNPSGAITLDNSRIGVYERTTKILYLNGLIDEVKLYYYPLSAAQVRQDYNDGLAASLSSADGGQNIQNGLVGHWKMDESTTSWDGANDPVADYSGNGYHGTSYNNAHASTTAVYGNSGEFNGSTDYVEVGDSSALRLISGGTISAWIYPRTYGANNLGRIVEKTRTGPNRNYDVNLTGTGQVQFDVKGSSTYTSASAISLNQWQYISVVFTNQGRKIYVNGVDKTSTGATEKTLPEDSSGSLRMGNSESAAGREFDGMIDDVKIYNTARTSDQIMQDYLNGPGPIAYYNFDEATGTSLIDRSGQGNNSASFGGSLGNSNSDWVVGKRNGALKFDGSNDYVDIGTNAVVLPEAWTTTAWVKVKAGSANTFISFGSTYPAIYFQHDATTRPLIYLGSSNYRYFDASAYTTLIDGNWHYVAFSVPGSRQTDISNAQMYIDGKSIGVYSTTNGGAQTAKSHLFIGTEDATPSRMFNGSMDDLKIYNYVLTPWQIAQEYNSGKPVGYWKMDEGQGGTTGDYSGNGNNGTLVLGGSPATSSAWQASSNCKLNGCLSFDGTNDYVTIADPASGLLDFGTNDFSISYWIRASGSWTTNQEYGIINKNTTYENIAGWGSELSTWGRSTNQYALSFYITNPAWANNVFTSSNVLNFDQWYHVVGVRSSSTINFYIDGMLQGTKTNANVIGNVSNAQPIIIGDHSWGPNFSGKIDEVKVFNYALSPAQVRNDYNMGKGIFFK